MTNTLDTYANGRRREREREREKGWAAFLLYERPILFMSIKFSMRVQTERVGTTVTRPTFTYSTTRKKKTVPSFTSPMKINALADSFDELFEGKFVRAGCKYAAEWPQVSSMYCEQSPCSGE